MPFCSQARTVPLFISGVFILRHAAASHEQNGATSSVFLPMVKVKKSCPNVWKWKKGETLYWNPRILISGETLSWKQKNSTGCVHCGRIPEQHTPSSELCKKFLTTWWCRASPAGPTCDLYRTASNSRRAPCPAGSGQAMILLRIHFAYDACTCCAAGRGETPHGSPHQIIVDLAADSQEMEY